MFQENLQNPRNISFFKDILPIEGLMIQIDDFVDHPIDGDSASNAINCRSRGQSTAKVWTGNRPRLVSKVREIFGKTRATLEASRNHDVKHG